MSNQNEELLQDELEKDLTPLPPLQMKKDYSEFAENQKPVRDNTWIMFAIGASIGFALCNTSLSSITLKVGPICVLYFASGSIITGLIHHLVGSIRNYQNGGFFWNNQNLRVNGRWDRKNLLGYIVFCLSLCMI